MDTWVPVKKTALLGALALGFAIFVWWLYRWSFVTETTEDGLVDDVSLGRALVFYVVVGALASGALARYWDQAWHAGIGNRLRGVVVAVVPVVAAAFGAIQVLAESWDGSFWSVVEATAEAYKWSLIIVSGALLAAMLMSLFTQAGRSEVPKCEPLIDPPDPFGHRTIGISCSGGGIRSAAYTLGGLAALENSELPANWKNDPAKPRKNPAGVLGNADYLSSVSGGGYAAASWRIAAGTGATPPTDKIPKLGTPEQIETGASTSDDPQGLIAHIMRRRRYLANGRGGLPGALVQIFAFGAWHFGMLALLVFVLAWPAGWINATWTRSINEMDPGSDAMPVVGGVDLDYWPTLIAAGLFVAPFVVRLLMVEGDGRARVDGGAKLGAAMFVLVGGGTLALPFLVDQIGEFVSTGDSRAIGAGIWATVISAVWQMGKRFVQPYLKLLGGVMLALGVAAAGLAIMSLRDGSESGQMLQTLDIAWGIGTAIMFVGFAYMNPDSWSLNRFYRRRLAMTFAASATTADGLTFEPSDDDERFDEYANAWGPQPIVCCAAARERTIHTGISVVSLIVEPRGLTVFRWKPRMHEPTAETLCPEDLLARLPSSRQGQRAFSIMGAAAISGAAVAPSLGRLSVGTTNVLFAAFNARLGMWLPNPSARDFEDKTTPRLVNMFKEMQSVYDSADPNLYASDGGHWENLGLVELLRKRCNLIVSFDASRDAPGSLLRLKDAIDLAKIELKIDIDAKAVHDAMQADDYSGLPGVNFGLIEFTYPKLNPLDPAEEPTPGRILFIKAAVAEYSSVELRRYAASDAKFPNFSTGDQLLTSDQFSQLARLGYESTERAIADHGEDMWQILEPTAAMQIDLAADQPSVGG